MNQLTKSFEKFLDLNFFIPVWILTATPSILIYRGSGVNPATIEAANQTTQAAMEAAIFSFFSTPAGALVLVFTMLCQILITTISLKKAKDDDISVKECLNQAVEASPRFLLTIVVFSLIIGFAILIGVMTAGFGFIIIAPALMWFSIASLFWMASMLENKTSGFSSITESINLSKGKVWYMFFTLTVTGISIAITQSILLTIGSLANETMGILLGAASGPLGPLVLAQMYIDFSKSTKQEDKQEN